jgi:hypothetical protein
VTIRPVFLGDSPVFAVCPGNFLTTNKTPFCAVFHASSRFGYDLEEIINEMRHVDDQADVMLSNSLPHNYAAVSVQLLVSFIPIMMNEEIEKKGRLFNDAACCTCYRPILYGIVLHFYY